MHIPSGWPQHVEGILAV